MKKKGKQFQKTDLRRKEKETKNKQTKKKNRKKTGEENTPWSYSDSTETAATGGSPNGKKYIFDSAVTKLRFG